MIEITNFDGTRSEKVYTLSDNIVTVDKLWENASPTSAFPPQTVPITGDYDQVIVNGYDEPTGVIIASLNIVASISRIAQVDAATASWLAQRSIRYTGTGIIFNETKVKYTDRGGPAETNNAYCVPYQIFGIKIQRED